MRKNSIRLVLSALLILSVFAALALGTTATFAAPLKLTASEISHLQFIREEEKLARDIYYLLAEQWELRIFTKIAESEQRHTDAVRLVLEKYGAADPAKGTLPGIFADKNLQDLYKLLMTEGGKSSLEALKVGALTEEKDISDINLAVKETNKADLIELYAYLKDGSSTHLRGFMAQIKAAGGSYSPQFISQEEFEKAMNYN